MANKRKDKELKFALNNDDYRALGRYRILHTEQGRKLVARQRFTYLLTAVLLAAVITVLKLGSGITTVLYAVAIALGVSGMIFAEKLVLRQQDRNIQASENDAARIYRADNALRFMDETFTNTVGSEEQTFSYKDIQRIDLTDEAIYVWMSEEAIICMPLHAFRNADDMKNFHAWICDKARMNGAKLT